MGDFQEPLDIWNRAAQHCGVRQIASYAEDSKQAQEIGFAYDKLRRAELRRNVWRFATRTAVLRPIGVETRLIMPAAWDKTWAYRGGDIVSWKGVNYQATGRNGNLNQEPDFSSCGFWDVYFGPVTAEPFSPTGGYAPGEIVYVDNGNGWVDYYAKVGPARPAQPSDATSTWTPASPSQWSAATIYPLQSVVQFTDGFFYMSLADFNVGNSPDASPAPWNPGISYTAGQQVCGSDGAIYKANATTSANPVGATPGTFAAPGPWSLVNPVCPWTPAFSQTTNTNGWRKLPCRTSPVVYSWPFGVGPVEQSFSRNAFRLPNGFLRKAPQDPTAGAIGWLGAETSLPITDWVFQDDLLMSASFFQIPLRFVADMQNVRKFDDMFCEGLAARIAYEVVESLTQSGGKKQAIGASYKTFMGEARTVNAIDCGADQPPADEFLTVRM